MTTETVMPMPDPYKVGNVHFVDSYTNSNGTNYLFRGSLPLIHNEDDSYTFNTPGLKDAILQAAAEAKVELPEIYQIRDINLLQWQNPDEDPRILTEYYHFLNNPGDGEFLFWETNGTGVCPLDQPLMEPAVRNYLALNLDQWLGDQLVYRMDMLRSYLETDTTPTVIYAHCEGGMDRTGELMAAYYMRWMGMSWSDANALNTKFAGRPFGCNNYRAAVWYAIYLYLTTGKPEDYAQPFQCDNAGNYQIACPDQTAGVTE
jgi:hypothetical protein